MFLSAIARLESRTLLTGGRPSRVTGAVLQHLGIVSRSEPVLQML